MVRIAAAGAALIAIGAGAIIAACGGSDADDDNANGASSSGTDISVSMIDNQFKPKEIVVPAGAAITITATNDGLAIHNLLVTVEERQFGTKLLVGPKEASTFEVTFPKPGKYAFVCGLHLPDMAGTITAK